MATFRNQATLYVNGAPTASNVVTGELLEVLAIHKYASGNYVPGEPITYIITLVNSGATPLNNISVTDNLGQYNLPGTPTTTLYPLTFVPGSVQMLNDGILAGQPGIVPGPPLVFSGITVPAYGNTTIVYKATPNEYAPPTTGGTITNTATPAGAGLTPLDASATVTAAAAPVLSINKSLSPAVVTEDGQLTYTFEITNSGNTDATVTDNLFIEDTFNPILNNLTVTVNGQPWTEPDNYTYDASTGAFATVPGQLTVPRASYTQDPQTGEWTVTPNSTTVVVTGTV